MTSGGDAVIHSWTDGRKQINIYNLDGQIVETHPSPHICTHSEYNTKEKDLSGSMVAVNVNNTQHIALSCKFCGIFLLNRQNNAHTKAFKKQPYWIKTQPVFPCQGPNHRLLTSSCNLPQRLIHVFEYSNPASITFKEHITFPDKIDSECTSRVCYDESSVSGGRIVVTYTDIHYIGAMSLKTKQLAWRVQGEVAGKKCRPCGVTSDGMGRIYVADSFNGRVLILRARDGQVIQVLDLGLYLIEEIAWRPTQPHLMLCCQPKKGHDIHVSLYNVE